MGRFAPSPSGPLHFGSVVAALASWLDARAANGRWVVRIEDVDTPRIVAGADRAILDGLVRLGLVWDGEPVYQSRRHHAYQAALDRLLAEGRAFACGCTRREMADSALARDGSRRYPGTCRERPPDDRAPRSFRLRTAPGTLEIDDPVQGLTTEDVARDVGDFVLRRADGVFAYQLAVVVDDAEQGVTDVVRGSDLLDSTGRQVFLQRALGLPPVRYLHLPVVAATDGTKLSKQTGALPVDGQDPVALLASALRFLGQPAPSRSENTPLPPLDRLLAEAVAAWDRTRIPRVRALVQTPQGW